MINFKNYVTVIIMSENILKITAKIYDLSIHDLVVIPKTQVSEKKEILSLSLKTITFIFHSHSCKFFVFNFKVIQ